MDKPTANMEPNNTTNQQLFDRFLCESKCDKFAKSWAQGIIIGHDNFKEFKERTDAVMAALSASNLYWDDDKSFMNYPTSKEKRNNLPEETEWTADYKDKTIGPISNYSKDALAWVTEADLKTPARDFSLLTIPPETASSYRIPPKCCGNCFKVPKTGHNPLRACLGCKKEEYCNKQCQKKHWKEHKEQCTATAATKIATTNADSETQSNAQF